VKGEKGAPLVGGAPFSLFTFNFSRSYEIDQPIRDHNPLPDLLPVDEPLDGFVGERGRDHFVFRSVAADVDLYEGDVDTALRHYASQVVIARRENDPIRLVWTLYYVAICHAMRRAPELGIPVAQECLLVAESTANPTAVSMARYALGLVLKKSDPDRALGLFDEAAEAGTSVRNVWWQGIALMEAAATRAVHGEAAVAARTFVDVLDHWDRVGDRTQQWLNLRYIVRLLVRLGAEEDAVVLHHYLLAAGRPSPLDAPRAGRLLDGPRGKGFAAAARRGSGLSVADAVSLARSGLQRFA